MRYSSIPPTDFQITGATLRDIHAIHRLEKEVFPLDVYPHIDLLLLFLTPGMINLKAVNAKGELIAFVAGSRSWFKSQPAWIITLAVSKTYQRQGIGRALLLTCEEAMGNRRVRLTVRKSNQGAIRLYEKAGYQHLFVRPHYYRGGEDGLVMEKQLYSR